MVLGQRPISGQGYSKNDEREATRLHLVDSIEIGTVELTLPFAAIGPRSVKLQTKEPSELGEKIEAFTKRSIEVAAAILFLLLASPLLIAVAVAIKATSPGPVLYKHSRIGRGGKPIRVWKFRSMRNDIDPEVVRLAIEQDRNRVESPVYKSPEDPRITSIGRFIRRTGIDEIPQLFNVIGGSMALVGPRPLVAEEVAELNAAQFAYRNSVLPGLTGLWQVFRSLETSFDERIRLDLVYVGCRSLWLDAYLIAMTPIALVRGDRSF